MWRLAYRKQCIPRWPDNLKTGTLSMPAFLLVQDYEGDMLLTDYSFLIEHKGSGRRVLFDLGLRKVCRGILLPSFQY